MSAIITSWLFDGEGRGKELTRPDEFPAMSDPTPLWVHLSIHNPGCEEMIRQTVPDIPDTALDALIAQETRPRMERFREGVFINLRGVNLNPGEDPEDLIALRIWVTANRVITVRRRKLKTIKDIRLRLGGSGHPGPVTTGEFVVQLAEGLTDRLGDVIEVMDEDLEKIEERTEISSDFIPAINNMRRMCVILRRHLVPQESALVRLAGLSVDWLHDSDKDELKLILDDVHRHLENMDEIKERANIVRDRISHESAEKINRTIFSLTLLAAMFMPMTFVTGLLGINVGGIPGSEHPVAFWYVAGGLLALAVFQFVMFKILKL